MARISDLWPPDICLRSAQPRSTQLLHIPREFVASNTRLVSQLSHAEASGCAAINNPLWTAPVYGKPIVKPQNSSIIYNLGFSKIGGDIFTWEITSQRKKKAQIQPKTPLNRAVIRTPVRPKKQAIQPQIRSLQTPLIPRSPPLLISSPQQSLKPLPIRLPLRSTPRSRTPRFLDGQTPHKRRQHKVVIRRAQETPVTEVITHVTRGGRPVWQKRVEYK